MAMNRRGWLKGLGAVVGSGAVVATTAMVVEKETIVEVEYALPMVEDVIQKVKDGLEITNVEAMVYANELQRRCSLYMNDARHGESGPNEAYVKGLEMFSWVQGNIKNLLKVHPYVKCVVVGYIRLVDENTARYNKTA